MDFKSLLESRSQREQHMIFMSGFLIMFYLLYLSWDYFDRLYQSALANYELQLNNYISMNSPQEIQNRLELATKRLQDSKIELENLKAENSFIQSHTKNLVAIQDKFSSSSEILSFIGDKAKEHNIKISQILPNNIKENSAILYDYNLSFSSTFTQTLAFIDALKGSFIDIKEARFEPYSSQIRLSLQRVK
jgi:hypothetical protein